MDQRIIDRAVSIATKAALNGMPAERILWIPSTTATGNPLGSFAIKYYERLDPSATEPW